MTKGKGNKKKKSADTGKSVSDYQSTNKNNRNKSAIAAFIPSVPAGSVRSKK